MRGSFASASHWLGRRRWLVLLAAVAAVLLAGAPGVGQQAARAATTPVTVSLTFDDSNADQLAAEQAMHAAGLHGTFYTVDGWLNQSGYLTTAQLAQISGDGNEIGGHTVEHQDLPTLASAEQEREICNDRANLISLGYQPTDFAYPYGDADTTEAYAKACGYNSARGLGDVVDPQGDCVGCVYGETTPPPDPYYLRAPDEVDSTVTLAQMEQQVTNAQAHKGGWVIYTYHHICSDIGAADCPSDLSTTPTIFNAFMTWLAGQATHGVTVKTVKQMIGGTFKPAVTINPPAAAAPGVNALVDPWLTSTDASTGFPGCYQPGGWGTNTVAWATDTDVPPGAPAGSQSQALTVTSYSSGDAKLLPTLDLGACTPTVVPGNSYTVSVQYESTAITQFALYYRTTTGAWAYWTSSPWFAASSTWTTATYTTPAVPAGANGVTFGLALIANGTLDTNDYSFVLPGSASSHAAGKTVTSAVAAHPAGPKFGGRRHVHSHAKRYVPKLKPGQKFAIQETAGPHAKEPG
jgi:peptidoglycan/xylan/chitin deacetylase (PgdA/CDA1 family)